MVYEPAPKPVKEYVPGVPVMTGPTAGDPTVLPTETLFTNLGGTGFAIALPYVIVPSTVGGPPVGATVGVAVAVAVFPDRTVTLPLINGFATGPNANAIKT